MTKLPPQNLDAERSVLGAAMLSPEAAFEVMQALSKNDFYHDRHSEIFGAMKELFERGEPIDEITLTASMRKSDRLERAGGAAYVVGLTDCVPTAANAMHYARIVHECATLRLILLGLNDAKEAVNKHDLQRCLDKLNSLAASHGESTQPSAPLSDSNWPRLPNEALHGLAGDLVRAVDPETEADPAAVLVQMLVTFGNVIGRGPYLPVGSGRHYTNENVILVGTTGCRKGTAWEHIETLFKLVDPDFLKKGVRSGLASGEGLIHHVRDESNSDDQPLLIFEGEFAGPLSVALREGNTLSPTIRNAWDSRALGTLTKNSPATASAAHISIIGHITPAELKSRLAANEISNGFANRFLWICVRRSKQLDHDGYFPGSAMQPIAERVRTAVAFAKNVKELRRTKEAEILWRDAKRGLNIPRAGHYEAICARAVPHIMRLSCIYALLDKSELITTHHINAALAIWDYAEKSARMIFGESVGDATADAILKALRDKPEGMTRTEISRIFSGNKKSNQLTYAFQILESAGLIESQRQCTSGAPREIWRVRQSELHLNSLNTLISSNSCFVTGQEEAAYDAGH